MGHTAILLYVWMRWHVVHVVYTLTGYRVCMHHGSINTHSTPTQPCMHVPWGAGGSRRMVGAQVHVVKLVNEIGTQSLVPRRGVGIPHNSCEFTDNVDIFDVVE